MCVNGVLVGFQVSLLGQEPQVLGVLEHVFTLVFLLEVFARLAACGWAWLCDAANLVDVLLILVTGVLPLWILQPAGVESEGMRMLQVLRILRLLKVVRVARTHRSLRTAYKLAAGLQYSGNTIFHTYVIIGTALYIFSVFSVYFIGRSEAFGEDPNAQELAAELFLTVPRSLMTIFQTMTLDSWSSVARPLMKHSGVVCALFTAVIMIMTLVLQNLITAIIVNGAISRLNEDHEMLAAEAREAMQEELQDLLELFEALDEDGDGVVSKAQYFAAVKGHEAFRNKLQVLQVPLDEAADLWELFDMGGVVDASNFAQTLRVLKGDAKGKDSFTAVQRLRRINGRVARLKERLLQYQRRALELRSQAEVVGRDLAVALLEVKQFAVYAGSCLPVLPAPRPPAKLAALRSEIPKRPKLLE